MKRIALTIAAAAWVAASFAGCRTAPSHAPTFKDLRELTTMKTEQILKQGKMGKLTVLLRAMQFTPADLRKIQDSGNVRLLVGAAAVTGADNPLAPELLRLALARAPEDPEAVAVFAYRAILSQSQARISDSEFLAALNQWRKLEPENSVPYYLEAAWQIRDEKFAEAAGALAEASGHPKFDSHCAALRLDTVAAGDFVGYPKFTARLLALTFLGETQLGITGWRCLNWEGAHEPVARDCIVLGKRLEAEGALLAGALTGLALQSAAMKKFPQTGSEADLKRIEERMKELEEIRDRISDLSPRLSEKRFVAFLDEGLAGSEAAADKKLIAEYGGSAK
jgi:hypothetical protein